MVEKMRTILEALVRRHGPVYTFAIMQMDELVDKWTVILSAPWATPQSSSEVFEEIRQLIVKILSADELSTVARVGIWSKHEHFIQLLLQYQAGSEITDTKINGNMVYKAHVFESNANADKAVRSEVSSS